MPEQSVAQQLDTVNRLLAETRKGEASWVLTGTNGTFRAAHGEALAILGPKPENAFQYVLRFLVTGRPEWDTVIEQSLPDAVPYPQEQERDAALALLYQYVSAKLGTTPSAVDVFFARDTGKEADGSGS